MTCPVEASEIFANLSVAVVDDNAALRGAVRTVLTSFGCKRVLEANHAQAAMDLVTTHDIDLMIVDWKMTPVDGLCLVQSLRDRKTSPNPYIPIIMLTSYDSPERTRQARNAGVDGFLVKPFDAERLYDALANIINNPRSYVRTSSFFGPDRRSEFTPYSGEDRRANSRL